MGKNFSLTPEQCEARSIQTKKLWQDPEYKKKMCVKLSQVEKTPEWRAKMSEAKKDIPKSEDHKKAMRETHRIRCGAVKLIMAELNIGWREASKIYMTDKEKYRNNFINTTV